VATVRTVAILCAILFLSFEGWGEVMISGRVVDDRGSPVPDARISISSESKHRLASTSTDPSGFFQLQLDQPGSYLLSGSKQGFFEIKNYQLTVAESQLEIVLTMNPLR
jgi:uncharacterized GH25 family protein